MKRKRNAQKIYNCKYMYLENTCVTVSELEWQKLMEGAVKADGKKIRKLIKKHLPELYHRCMAKL